MNLPTLPADKANHYLYGGIAAVAGAATGLFLALSLARQGLLPHWPWLMLANAGAGALLFAHLAGRWKEQRDAYANHRAAEAHVRALDAAQAAGAPAPPELVLPHEVSAADMWATTAGALPVLATLTVVALGTLWR